MYPPHHFKQLNLENTEATRRAGVELAAHLEAGAVLALTGPLGAGKTHLAKGICAGLGCPDEVHSPTFGLLHEHRDGKLPVFHFDLYRAEHLEEVEQIGWDDYLDEGGVVIAEWADRFPDLFPPASLWLEMNYAPAGPGRRLRMRKAPDPSA